MVVYLDLVMLLNFTVDLLLLLGANRMSGLGWGLGRCIRGAAIGGIYGGACVLPGFHFLGNGIWRIVFLILVGLAAFGANRTAMGRTAVFLILSMALGGIGNELGGGSLGLVVCGVVLWLMCRVGFHRMPEGKYIPSELFWKGRSVTLYALHDTGNLLRDPMTGERVLVCGADVGEELLGIPRSAFRNPVGSMEMIPGSRLIPYHTVGQPKGMLLALRPDKAVIGGSVQTPLIAFAPDEISKGKVYRMLIGGIM